MTWYASGCSHFHGICRWMCLWWSQWAFSLLSSTCKEWHIAIKKLAVNSETKLVYNSPPLPPSKREEEVPHDKPEKHHCLWWKPCQNVWQRTCYLHWRCMHAKLWLCDLLRSWVIFLFFYLLFLYFYFILLMPALLRGPLDLPAHS